MNKSDMKDKKNTHKVLSYIKISTLVGRNDNFLTKARQLLILRTSLDLYRCYSTANEGQRVISARHLDICSEGFSPRADFKGEGRCHSSS